MSPFCGPPKEAHGNGDIRNEFEGTRAIGSILSREEKGVEFDQRGGVVAVELSSDEALVCSLSGAGGCWVGASVAREALPSGDRRIAAGGGSGSGAGAVLGLRADPRRGVFGAGRVRDAGRDVAAVVGESGCVAGSAAACGGSEVARPQGTFRRDVADGRIASRLVRGTSRRSEEHT